MIRDYVEARLRLGHRRVRDGPLGGHPGVEEHDACALERADRGIAFEEAVRLAMVYEICQDADDPLGVF